MKLDELSKPIDKQTTIVTFPNVKDWYIPQKKLGCHYISKIPIDTKKFIDTGKTGTDLTGIRFGRLIVIGYLGRPNKKKRNGRWLVKCDCGFYTIKSTSCLKKNKGDDSIMCIYCKDNEFIKRGAKGR